MPGLLDQPGALGVGQRQLHRRLGQTGAPAQIGPGERPGLAQEIEDRITPDVKKELTPLDESKKPKKLDKDEAAKLKKDISAEVKKRVAAEMKKVQKTELPKRVEAAQAPEKLKPALDAARARLPADTAAAIEEDLATRTKEEAKRVFDGMTYNERQTYVKEHFEEEPGVSQAERDSKKYSDGSIKPIFVHVGPELSGVGTKLLGTPACAY